MTDKPDRRRSCETCGTVFCPRPTQLRMGQGRFCSQRCNTAAREALHAPESMERAVETMRKMRANGEINYRRGEDHPCWNGGPEMHNRRYIESGKANAQLRRYRAANPHKAREWAQNRRYRKVGRLPYGTIPKTGERQKWRCTICRTCIRDSYHVDHITPIAKGGKHAPDNIQLLCGPCNLRKSDKDPISHMQELGRLL